MKNSESMEMYLETIHILEKSYGHAHVVEIAKRLGVSKPSVSQATNYLKGKGLVNKEAYGTITLTKKGKEFSKQIFANHQLISLFLEHSLELTAEEADKNACRMEHVLSDDILEAMKTYLYKNNVSIDR
ncbi:MAG: metal-dependent transcriptional regulator [Anaerosolibacter sp.]|jgi:Mn-dependent DtxR family transcriptional regulator|uniref:metal-dependent transcriptional regulator n=1 Tax=Anaerosolibacter sp. TaxID=1872527 RepID=UPI00260619C3|nr:metal-dependent transcriptional regulator [Anaerosolibacter sp.]MDF2545153.1 metal-dependent transcriptional regulator [Anaerosolibacter sp.]